MSPFNSLRRKTLRWRVSWQKTILRLRRFLSLGKRWFASNVPWRQLPYVLVGALIVSAIWGLSARRDALSHRLKIPSWNEPGKSSPADAEITALSRLESEVAMLKARLKQLTESAAASPAADFNPSRFGRPALGAVSQGMGWVRTGGEWRFHDGVDLSLPEGSNIVAAADGVVKNISSLPGLGTVVTIEHGNGWESRYGQVEGLLVTPGQKIARGTVLGRSAAENCQGTPGFHFSIYLKDEPVDPVGIIPGLEH